MEEAGANAGALGFLTDVTGPPMSRPFVTLLVPHGFEVAEKLRKYLQLLLSRAAGSDSSSFLFLVLDK